MQAKAAGVFPALPNFVPRSRVKWPKRLARAFAWTRPKERKCIGVQERIAIDQWKVLRGSVLESGGVLRLAPDQEGSVRLRIEGETAAMAGVRWSADKWLIVDMLADMDSVVSVQFPFYRKGEVIPSGESRHMLSYRLLPMRRIKVAVRLEELASRRYYLDMLLGGMLEGHANGRPASVEQMDAMEMAVSSPYGDRFSSLTIYDVYLTDDLPDMTVEGGPMVDEFGQWMGKDWDTKIHSEAQLAGYLKAEREAARESAGYPAGWSRWGGWLEKRFDATGFFHTHHDGKRWWLVDPDGYAFFSNGMCYGSRMGVHGFTDRRETLFSWLPDPEDPTYRDAWTTADQIPEFAKRNGPGVGRDRKMFNFARANMIRVFGRDGWWDAWQAINTARLKSWGFNTIGVGVNNYEDEDVLKYLEKARIPFVWTLKKFPRTDVRIFRDFPDVYSETFRSQAQEFAEIQLRGLVGNPYLIGYFVNNEPEWKVPYINLAERVFAHPDRLGSKAALVDWLREKYRDIGALNARWGQSFGSFEDLYQPAGRLDAGAPGAKEDFAAMHALLMEKYITVLKDALTGVDPDHLNLGMRYAGAGPREMAGCEHYDVFSFNHYAPSAAQALETAGAHKDVPMVIGEWHIGGEKSLLAHGLWFSRSQEERGRACEFYMQGAMANKNCVGIHYFEMNDQPLLGRFDGENMAHGAIDVCNRPYAELTAHFRHAAERMYPLCAGEEAPTQITGETLQRR